MTICNTHGNGLAIPHAGYDASDDLHSILEAAATTSLDTRITVFESAAAQLQTTQGDAGGLDIGGSVDAVADETAQALAAVLTRDEAVTAGIIDLPAYPGTVSLDANIALAHQNRVVPDATNVEWFYN